MNSYLFYFILFYRFIEFSDVTHSIHKDGFWQSVM